MKRALLSPRTLGVLGILLVAALGVFVFARDAIFPGDGATCESGDDGGPGAGDPITNSVEDFGLERIDLDVKDALEFLEKGFEARDADAVVARVTDDFAGTVFTDHVALPAEGDEDPNRIVESHTEDEGVAVRGREELRSALEELFGRYLYVHDSFFKAKQYRDVRTRRVEAKVRQDLRGKRKDGGIQQDYVYWEMVLAKTDGEWKVQRADVVERHQVASTRLLSCPLDDSLPPLSLFCQNRCIFTPPRGLDIQWFGGDR